MAVSGRPVRSQNCVQLETLLQAQRIEHEFERQFRAADFVVLRDGLAGQRVVHVELGLAKAHLAHDAVREAELAVRARRRCPGSRRTASSSCCASSGGPAWHRPTPRSGPCPRRAVISVMRSSMA